MTALNEYKSAIELAMTDVENGVKALREEDGVKVDGDTVHIDPVRYNQIAEAKTRLRNLLDVAKTDGELAGIKALFDEKVEEKQVYNTAPQYKTFGEQFADSAELKDMLDSRNNQSKDYEINAADVVAANNEVKDVYSALAPYTSTVGIGGVRQTLPLVDRPQQRQRVRDLFPTNRTSSNLIEFFRVLEMANGGKGAASVVPDYDTGNFGLKPKSTLSFESDSAQVRTIAHWVAVHRNTLADKPQLRSIIDSQLFYGLALVEDAELLNGSGSGEHIRGILNTPGILTYSKTANGVASDLKSDSLRRAATLSALSLFPATGYVVHPNDWEDIELQKGTAGDSGDGQYMLFTNVSVGAAARLWRLPVVETPVIAEGTFLTGAFGQGVQIWDRERANIRVTDSHADFFVRNALAVLAEERLALTVTYPQSIVAGSFA